MNLWRAYDPTNAWMGPIHEREALAVADMNARNDAFERRGLARTTIVIVPDPEHPGRCLNRSGMPVGRVVDGRGSVLWRPEDRPPLDRAHDTWMSLCRVQGLDSLEQETAILSVGREFLPPEALAVLDGANASATYFEWLAGQLSA